MVPHRLIDRQACEPAKQQVVVQLFAARSTSSCTSEPFLWIHSELSFWQMCLLGAAARGRGNHNQQRRSLGYTGEQGHTSPGRHARDLEIR